MSDYYKKLTIGPRHAQLNWTNAIVTLHDLQCQCDDPLCHTIETIVNQEKSLKFSKGLSDKIKPCLTTGEDGAVDVVEDFGDDDLERLFAEDATGDTDTG